MGNCCHKLFMYIDNVQNSMMDNLNRETTREKEMKPIKYSDSDDEIEEWGIL